MPVKVEYAVEAHCSPEQVWQVFADLERWSEWAPDVFAGCRWTHGTRWARGGRCVLTLVETSAELHPVIVSAQPPLGFTWITRRAGLTSEQRFDFAAVSGGTRIAVHEEIAGYRTLFQGERIERAMLALYEKWLGALARRSQALAGARRAAAGA